MSPPRAPMVMLVTVLMAGALLMESSAEAMKSKGQRTGRKVKVEYVASLGTPQTGGACTYVVNPCPVIPLTSDERFIKVVVSDGSGTPTAFTIAQDPDDDHVTDTVGSYCGSTGRDLVAVAPGMDVVIYPWVSGGTSCAGAVGTQGRATLTITNRR